MHLASLLKREPVVRKRAATLTCVKATALLVRIHTIRIGLEQSLSLLFLVFANNFVNLVIRIHQITDGFIMV